MAPAPRFRKADQIIVTMRNHKTYQVNAFMQKPYQFPQDGLQLQDVPAVTDGKTKVEIMTGASVASAQVSRRAFLGGAMTIAGGALASSLLAPAPFAKAKEPIASPLLRPHRRAPAQSG